jgi:hypothetical protein
MSVPEVAGIAVDRKFGGNTAATLRVPAGEHTIAIVGKDFQNWKRNAAFLAGESITIRTKLNQDLATAAVCTGKSFTGRFRMRSRR